MDRMVDKGWLRTYVIWLLIAVGIVVLLKGILMRSPWKPEVTVTTRDALQTRLAMLTKTAQYRRGGELLKKSATSGFPDPKGSVEEAKQSSDIAFRVAVDFLRTLTPTQAGVMTKDEKLPFKMLDSNQQSLLRLLSRSSGSKVKLSEDAVQESYVVVRVWRDGGHSEFEWHILESDGKDMGHAVGLTPQD